MVVALNSCLLGWRIKVERLGIDAVDEAVHQAELLLHVVDDVRRAERHHRPVVDRVMEARPRHHQRIEMGDGEADRHALALRADHPAGRGAVPVEMVALAPERGRRAVGAAVDHIGDVADQGGIEDLVDRLAVVAAALVHALDLVHRRDAEGVGGVLGGLAAARWSGCS